VTRLLYLVRHGEARDDVGPDNGGLDDGGRDDGGRDDGGRDDGGRDDGGLGGGGLSDAGRRQADLVGQRLRDVPLGAIRHGPLPRAAATAAVIAGHLPGVPLRESELVGDYPPAPPPEGSPVTFSRAELARGAALAEAALRRFAVSDGPDELIVTHSFLIAWFVRHALDAPPARWLGLNSGNGALTVIRYRPDRPPALVVFNDMSHLPEPLRWNGFPPDLRL
jgi:broad specificity phosphatase PhoE